MTITKRLIVGKDSAEIELMTAIPPADLNENAIEFIFNDEGHHICLLACGKYWTYAYNEDELFNDMPTAFKWLKERL